MQTPRLYCSRIYVCPFNECDCMMSIFIHVHLIRCWSSCWMFFPYHITIQIRFNQKSISPRTTCTACWWARIVISISKTAPKVNILWSLIHPNSRSGCIIVEIIARRTKPPIFYPWKQAISGNFYYIEINPFLRFY